MKSFDVSWFAGGGKTIVMIGHQLNLTRVNFYVFPKEWKSLGT